MFVTSAPWDPLQRLPVFPDGRGHPPRAGGTLQVLRECLLSTENRP